MISRDRWQDFTRALRRQLMADVESYRRGKAPGDRAIAGITAIAFFSANTAGGYPIVDVSAMMRELSLKLDYSFATALGAERSWTWIMTFSHRDGSDYPECNGHQLETTRTASEYILRPLIDPQFIPDESA